MSRWTPPGVQEIPQPPDVRKRRLLIAALILAVIVWVLLLRGHIRSQSVVPVVAEAEEVRSDVSLQHDSLEVVVGWQLTTAGPESAADSVRVEAGLDDGGISQVSTRAADRQADTLRLPAPSPGVTTRGYACVSAVRARRLARERCTPWEFVRPTDQPVGPGETVVDTAIGSAPAKASAMDERVVRVVVLPDGQQVDPDVGGKCARWQRTNPDSSVWIQVNRQAVADCTGPNRKPIVAQFCVFAELADGRRVKTTNSTNNPYCDRLFHTWASERTT